MERITGPRRPAVVTTVESSSRQTSPLPAVPSPVAHPLELRRALRDDDDGGIDWRRTASALWRGRGWIVGLTLLGTLAGLWASRFLHPIYLARTTIWIDESQRREAELGPIRSERLLDPEAWLDLLTSDAVLLPVVRAAGLVLLPSSPADSAALHGLTITDQYHPGEYVLRTDPSGAFWTLQSVDGAARDSGAVGDSVGRAVGLRWLPPPTALRPEQPIVFRLLGAQDAARQLATQLHSRTDLNGNFLTVELSGTSPRRITAILNAVADRYVQVATGLQRQKLTELVGLLEEQRRQAADQLQIAESTLERFRVQTITLPSLTDAGQGPNGQTTGRDPAFQAFFSGELERQSLRQDQEALAQSLAQNPDSGVDAGTLLGIGAVQHSAELSAMLKELTDREAELRAMQFRYGDTYPTIQRLREEITTLRRETIPRGVRALIAQLRGRESQLSAAATTTSQTLRQIPSRALEQSRLERSATLASTLYTDLQQRTDQARLAAASTVPDARVLDPATQPLLPVRSFSVRVVLLSFIGSLGLGIVGVLVVDRVDPRIRHPRQVTDIGVPILGVLPHCRPRSLFQMIGKPSRDLAELVEAVRAACFTLAEAHGPHRPMITTITSPGPGEGKSFVSANLAMAFAHGGLRTLLIDADLRRGIQHRSFHTDRRPGLGELLRGEAPLQEVVLATAHPRLALIPCGSRDRNPPALLGAPAFVNLLDDCSNDFDVILVDSPPLGAGVDALLLAKGTGNLVIVLRTGQSRGDVARIKLDVLSRVTTRVLGAILTDARSSIEYMPHSYSLPGYEASWEGTPSVPRLRPGAGDDA
ncbi:MAG TPA: polysaccharide biosynthesis tyrosine autokinase [Gemmatimonadales bacterium]